MGSLNRVTLIGRLGADPELKYTPAGAAVCNFSLATSEAWKDKGTGEKREQTIWHRIVVWRELGEACSKYLAKGREACVEGKIQIRTYEKDGQKHYATEIVAERVIFIGSGERDERSAPGDAPRGERSRKNDPPPAPIDDSDIPF